MSGEECDPTADSVIPGTRFITWLRAHTLSLTFYQLKLLRICSMNITKDMKLSRITRTESDLQLRHLLRKSLCYLIQSGRLPLLFCLPFYLRPCPKASFRSAASELLVGGSYFQAGGEFGALDKVWLDDQKP
jgi:hypothetical protein